MDIRFRAHCFKCKSPLSDKFLSLPEEKRFCYDHRHWSMKKEMSFFEPTPPSNAQSKRSEGE